MSSTVPIGDDPRRCTAHNTAGDRCGKWALRGTNVCIKHGGGAPQVRAAARRRLLELVDPAINRLAHLVEHADNDQTKLRAARDILDRVGIGEPLRIEVSEGESDVDRQIRELVEQLAAGTESPPPPSPPGGAVAPSNGNGTVRPT